MTQPQLFDPDRLTATGEPADCQMCGGKGERVSKLTGRLVVCGNCNGTGRAAIPF